MAARVTRIIIFAKAPVPGEVKTRLIPALGAKGAAELAERMLADTCREAVAAAVGPVELCLSGVPRGLFGPALGHLHRPRNRPCRP